MNRRFFFRQLASGLVAASAPGLFLPKLIKPGWKKPTLTQAEWDRLARLYAIQEILKEFRRAYRQLHIDGEAEFRWSNIPIRGSTIVESPYSDWK